MADTLGELTRAGVNVTLIFSRRRYGEVMEAFLRGVEGAHAAGRDLAGLARGRAAIANARLAFRAYEEIFTSGYDEAAEAMTALANLGIDYDDVMRNLEHDGLTTFQASWSALADTLEHKLAAGRRGGRKDGPP